MEVVVFFFFINDDAPTFSSTTTTTTTHHLSGIKVRLHLTLPLTLSSGLLGYSRPLSSLSFSTMDPNTELPELSPPPPPPPPPPPSSRPVLVVNHTFMDNKYDEDNYDDYSDDDNEVEDTSTTRPDDNISSASTVLYEESPSSPSPPQPPQSQLLPSPSIIPLSRALSPVLAPSPPPVCGKRKACDNDENANNNNKSKRPRIDRYYYGLITQNNPTYPGLVPPIPTFFDPFSYNLEDAVEKYMNIFKPLVEHVDIGAGITQLGTTHYDVGSLAMLGSNSPKKYSEYIERCISSLSNVYMKRITQEQFKHNLSELKTCNVWLITTNGYIFVDNRGNDSFIMGCVIDGQTVHSVPVNTLDIEAMYRIFVNDITKREISFYLDY